MANETLGALIHKYQESLKGGAKLTHAETKSLQTEIKALGEKYPDFKINLGNFGENKDGIDGAIGKYTRQAIAASDHILQELAAGKVPQPLSLTPPKAVVTSSTTTPSLQTLSVFGDSFADGIKKAGGLEGYAKVGASLFMKGALHLDANGSQFDSLPKGNYVVVSDGYNSAKMSGQDFLRNYEKTYEKTLQNLIANNNTPVILLPHSGKSYAGYTEHDKQNLQGIIDIQRNLAEKYHLHVVDMDEQLKKGTVKLSQSDHLHLSSYKGILDVILEVIKEPLQNVSLQAKPGQTR